MNLNLINLDPPQWSREDWNDAYSKYCEQTMFGVKTKKEYYDMVIDNYNRRVERDKPLDPALAAQWSKGRRKAVKWARKHPCILA